MMYLSYHMEQLKTHGDLNYFDLSVRYVSNNIHFSTYVPFELTNTTYYHVTNDGVFQCPVIAPISYFDYINDLLSPTYTDSHS